MQPTGSIPVARAGRIWVTRAEPGAEATAARLRALGHAPLVASLLGVRLLPPPDGAAGGPRRPGLHQRQRRAGVRRLDAALRDWPVLRGR